MTRPSLFLGALLAAVSSMVAGCGDEPRVAGGTTETENVVFALDSLLPPANRPRNRTTIATIRLDAARLDLSETDSLGRDVAVERLDGSPLPFEIVYWDKGASLFRLRVRIDTTLSAPGSRILVAWGRPIARRSSPENTWAGIPDSQRTAVNSVFVDDFQDGNLRSLLQDGLAWGLDTYDSLLVDRSVVLDPTRKDSVLRLRCTAQVAGKGYALTQLPLGRPRSLRAMDSIVFWARGPSKVAVAFTKNIPTLGTKAWKHVTLDSTWRRVVVTPTTFNRVDSIGGNYGWTAVRDSITDIGFFVSDGTELRLDDIRLHGVVREDLD